MEMTPTTIYLFSVLVLFFLVIAIVLRSRHRKQMEDLQKEYEAVVQKYSGISDVHEKLKSQRAELEGLRETYRKDKVTFDFLSAELKKVEETLDVQEAGVYQPHFDFDSSEDYKQKLTENYEKQKQAVKEGQAARCERPWTVDGSRKEGEKMTRNYMKLMLRAFDGESDASILKVRWNNAKTMEERIRKTFELINKSGESHTTSITREFLELKLEELYLTHELEEKKYQEKEEQRRIQEQIREEEKVQREIEEAKKKAESEERQYERALEQARQELESVQGEELDKLNAKIQTLSLALAEAHEKKERALSRAQITTSGHVYIISNIGSFGDHVLKIGMTRRLEPLDRIKELGDASVPFPFDVHAMIYSENAPDLEGKIHGFFRSKRINLVNQRKEFFTVTIDELEGFARTNGATMVLTKLAEAKEYRETVALREQQQLIPKQKTPEAVSFPDQLTA